MEQFSLEKWLENPSRKVVTERNNEVRIICTDINCAFPIVAAITISNRETPLSYDINGKCPYYEGNNLFFAYEEPESIKIPFGAKDSEFVRDEYYIPEGCRARIEGNKVIIERIQKEEQLTEFEKELINIVFKYKYWDSSKDKVKQGIKKDSKLLLDLARKELLKDLLKWKKATEKKDLEKHVAILEDGKVLLSNYLEEDDYYIDLEDLKTLPKEE